MGNARVLAFYITICFVAFVISKIVISILIYQRCCKRRKVFQDCVSGGKIVLFRSPLIQSLTSESFMKKTMKLTNRDIIGAGGYGTVYKLCVSDSVTFAVKKLNKGTADKDKGFEWELDAMGDIKHRNLVTLLIYEFMPNGSLDSYLHHDCIPHIIHRDIKSSNILLDKNMEARVSDFGLATLMGPDQTHVSTVVAGTFGYLAPEYFDTGRATSKGDVYSFGVVLLELLLRNEDKRMGRTKKKRGRGGRDRPTAKSGGGEGWWWWLSTKKKKKDEGGRW